MICNECGKTIRKDAAFCNFCGVPVGVINEDSNADELEKKSNIDELDESKIGVKEKLTSVIDKTKGAFDKLKKGDGQSDDKTRQKKLVMSVATIILIFVIVVVLAVFIPKSSGSDSQYVIFEKEDELVIYENNKEIMVLDYEGQYELVLADGAFSLTDQSGDDGASGLYAGYIKKNADVEEVSDASIIYELSSSTLAYVEKDDDDLILYVGKLGKMDDALEIDEEVTDVRLAGGGKAVYYTNMDNDVYVYKDGESDRLSKDAMISNVGDNANQVVLFEDIDDDEQTLVWYKGDKDFEIADGVNYVEYIEEGSLSLYAIADWDIDEAVGTLYYAEKFGKDPIEIDTDVSQFVLDTTIDMENGDDPEYVFYLKDSEWYVQEIGVAGGEQFLDEDENMQILEYDKARNIIYIYEDMDEILYYNIRSGEEGSIRLDDVFTDIQYKDGELLYENADEEIMYVGMDKEVELFSKMDWQMINGDYVFTINEDGDENESYVYQMHKGEVTELAENVQDFKVVGDSVYVLADYDAEDAEGTVYRLKLGKDKPVEMDDDVSWILVVN